MVKIRDVHDIYNETHVDVDEWVGRISDKVGLPAGQIVTLREAFELAFRVEQDRRTSGVGPGHRASAFLTGLEMAEILADLGLADEGLVAAILYRHVREDLLTLAEVEDRFGADVASLIKRVLQMAVISGMRNDGDAQVFGHNPEDQAGKIRQMLVSIIDDVRVALIKLAERTCAIRNAKHAGGEKRLRVAREIVDVYAPLAHRLGIGHLKWELEDLAFRYLEPLEYKHIARLLSEKRRDRQNYIDQLIETLRGELQRVGIEGEVYGRAKHIYSIWKKMQRKGISFSKVYDISAVRVLVPSVSDCYTLLGIVHSLWRNIPDEFDDYIAAPKENGYRSLHTAVIGPRSRVVEIQIRTWEMHEEAEFGICAHWQYKGTDDNSSSRGYESKIAWLRQVLEWHDEVGTEHVKDLFRHEGSSDRIYVFTPEGHVVDLPPVSSPLDFAYRIHTEVGHRCRGCRINGHIAPLNTPLKTADQVEILTGRNEAPSRDWLSATAGYLHTARARARVQQWLRKQDRTQNIEAGKEMLEKEFRQLGLPMPDLDELAGEFNRQGAENLYLAIGAGELNLGQVVRQARRRLDSALPHRRVSGRRAQASRYKRSEFYIYGVGDLLTRIARCCNPVPGDEISGYITSGRGVTIHRQDCGSFLRLRNQEPERIIQVRWGGKPEEVYDVPLSVKAWDRAGLLSDITSQVDRMGLAIGTLHSGETRQGMTDTRLTVELGNLDTLRTLIKRLQQLPNVIDVERVDDE